MYRSLQTVRQTGALLPTARRLAAHRPSATAWAWASTKTPNPGETSEQKKARSDVEGGYGGSPAPMPDSLADRDARGRTGGGEPLESTSDGAPSKPKVDNAKVQSGGKDLSEEQKREVEEHNRDFERKHDRAAPATDDKVDGKFWEGGGQREN